MKARDIAEFKENRHIVNLIAEFEEKLKKENDPFDFSFDDITAQTETHIIDVGLIGIEIVRQYLDVFDGAGTSVILYTKHGDGWVRCFSRKIDNWATIQLGVWDTLAAYREKLERQAKNEKKRKYRKGEQVRSVNELLDQEFVYWHDKIYARGWFLSWPLRMAYKAVKQGEIYKAERKGEVDA